MSSYASSFVPIVKQLYLSGVMVHGLYGIVTCKDKTHFHTTLMDMPTQYPYRGNLGRFAHVMFCTSIGMAAPILYPTLGLSLLQMRLNEPKVQVVIRPGQEEEDSIHCDITTETDH
jgi:hypothetical protein